MAKKPAAPAVRLTQAVHPARPDWTYHVLEPDKRTVAALAKAPRLPRGCDRPCTKTMTLLPRSQIQGHTGIGYQMINVDGYRWVNAYVISDALTSTNQRGFTLEISFSLHPFVYGVGVVGEARYFFNFDAFYDPGAGSHRLIRIETNDLASTGGLPHIGGVDLTHILRVPVMGPYLRASVFNEDTVARHATVEAYLTT